MLILISTYSTGQSKDWGKHYYLIGNNEQIISCGVEAYDKGFFLVGFDFNGTYSDIRIYKTDINGNILWQSIIGNTILSPVLGGIVCTNDGGMAIAGSINKTDSTFDNFLMKITSCGEMEWCKIYDLNINQYSDVSSILVLKNDDFVISASVAIRFDSIGSYYENWTFCTDPNGNFKWHNFDNLQAQHLVKDKNDNILTTGLDYIPYPSQPSTVWLHSGVNKTDSAGNVLWYSEYGLDHHILCGGNATAQTNDNGYVTVGFKRGVNGNNDAIFLIKYDDAGKALWTKFIGDTTQEEWPIDMIRISDSTFLISAATNDNVQNNFIYDLKLLIINSEGLVLKQVIFRNPGHPWQFNNISATSDGKYLMTAEEGYINGDSLLALKFNQNLELDTFYTHDTNKYDYLCSHKINPDSIIHFFSNDTVHITVPFPDTTRRQGFLIYPNPTSGNLNIQCPGNSSATAIVYDILGRQIRQYSFVPGGLGIAEINLGPIAPGIYVFVFTQNGKRYVQKVVVE